MVAVKSEHWEKEDDNGKVWWLDDKDDIGTYVFSFDKKKRFYLFRDYPSELSEEEKRTFDEENPFWAEFFKGKK